MDEKAVVSRHRAVERVWCLDYTNLARSLEYSIGAARSLEASHYTNGVATTSWSSGDLHSADSPNPDATATEHGGAMLPGGFVYQGRWYRGVAASNPIFLPPENFFIPQPQLWSQCACERICMRCVYDGEEFCEGCRATTLSVSSSTLYRSCNCEPGCCGLPGSSDLSESEEITEVSS